MNNSVNGKTVNETKEVQAVPLVFNKKSEAVTTSLLVAQKFGKQHKNVLQDIESKVLPFLTAEFSAMNFKKTTYKVRGRKFPIYEITKDGFMILVMGFTGKKAMQFKQDYITAFNKMHDWIKERNKLKLEYPDLTDAIQLSKENPKAYHFSNENFMLYDIILGQSSRKLKKEIGIENFRDVMNDEQVERLYKLQKHDTSMLYLNYDYAQRKTELKKLNNILIEKENKAIAA